VAEDYYTNQQIVVKHLNSAGFKVVLAENGARAVSLFKTKQIDLILMDIQMPEMDGYEATKQIRQIEKQVSKDLEKVLRTPIIAVTAHAMKGYREKCIQADMDDYLTKPLKRKDLISMIEKWMPLEPESAHSKAYKKQNTDHSIESPAVHDPLELLPIDMEKAIEEFDNDKTFFDEVLNEFLDHVKEQFLLIQNAIVENDFETIEKQAHSIKGGGR